MEFQNLTGYWSAGFVEEWLRTQGILGPIKRRTGVPPLANKETAEAYCAAALVEGSGYGGIIVQYEEVPKHLNDPPGWLVAWVGEKAVHDDDRVGVGGAWGFS